MKTLLAFMLMCVFAVPALADSTRTTTTSTYEESSSEPASEPVMDSEMIEAEEYDDSLSTEEVDQARWDEQQRMQEMEQDNSTVIEEEEAAVDYTDRTRTDRARKALNTGSDASDDK